METLKNIPLNIRNTNAPNDRGTFIQESFDTETDPDRIITGITGKKDFTIISMSKRGMSNQVGVLRKMLSVLEKYGISVDYVPNGIDNVSIVLPTESIASKLYNVLGEIQTEVEPDTLDVHDQIAIVAAVGRQLAYRPGISGKIFAAMGESGDYGSITRGKVANFYITKPLPSLAYISYAHQTPLIKSVVLKGKLKK